MNLELSDKEFFDLAKLVLWHAYDPRISTHGDITREYFDLGEGRVIMLASPNEALIQDDD